MAVAGTAPATGPVPLTPIQRWFFALPGPVHHYNQAFVLQTPAGLDPERLERALMVVVARHDALRLRFVRGEDGWRCDQGGGSTAARECVNFTADSCNCLSLVHTNGTGKRVQQPENPWRTVPI